MTTTNRSFTRVLHGIECIIAFTIVGREASDVMVTFPAASAKAIPLASLPIFQEAVDEAVQTYIRRHQS